MNEEVTSALDYSGRSENSRSVHFTYVEKYLVHVKHTHILGLSPAGESVKGLSAHYVQNLSQQRLKFYSFTYFIKS